MASSAKWKKLVEAFAADPKLARIATDYFAAQNAGKKKFGSSGLKVNGKIFAMMDSGDRFVVKLPKARVDELVEAGKGERFDPGHGRIMKEWLVVTAPRLSWIELAKEALAYVSR